MATCNVVSFGQEYSGAYSKGGFMKVTGTGITGGTGAWVPVVDPSGHMPRLPHGGDIQFVRILRPIPGAGEQGQILNLNLVAAYQGTGGAEIWAARTGVTGASGGHAWPRFQARLPTGNTVYCFYVEYGRVHSVPR